MNDAMNITNTWTRTLRTGRTVTVFCFATKAEGKAFAAWAKSMVDTKVQPENRTYHRVYVGH